MFIHICKGCPLPMASLTIMVIVQYFNNYSRWLYLEPILSNEEGELASKFRKVDQGFRQVARILEADPRLSALLQSARLQPMLDSISDQLLACQTALNQYIDEKRSTFPRLYFLSDDDLLELLGQARAGADGQAAVMQTHLKKLFPGTTGVSLGPGDMSITALRSLHGETLQLDHPVDIDCPVEVWLKNLETEMRSSLKNLTLKCVLTNSLQNQDPFSLPTQILCLAQNIRFTEQAEKAITTRELHKLKGNVEKENSYYASAELEDESERNKRQALILQCAHYMSVIRTLIDNNVTSTNDWLWQKQLRFYLMGSKDVEAKMGLAQISYSYEYLGVNTGQFVRTELADDCFLILTQALHLGLVGNPFGPAGTGKTESVKALGSLVGRLVLIFNCDGAMDSECLGRLLTGLALCGAWGCFDEFNRLSADTLATAAEQLHSLLAGTGTALLNGKQVVVSKWCGVAATMNPVGRGYGGRRALPAALDAVMRPVAMLAPRPETLAAHLLAANCVPHAQELASDLYNVFTMAGALITDERHYDWGLRALKASVCSAAAALVTPSTAPTPQAAQRAALRRLLARDNMSKLTTDSALRFENILSLVFVDVPVDAPTTIPIMKAIEASMENLKLAHNKHQVQKCAEFYEQLQQRMGVVIVGPPGSGKSTIRRMLKNALTNQGKNIVEYTICPKAMSRDWLLGNIDHDTRQWTDGVISATALEVSNQPSDVWSWVVCDGDIDPEWVEALNSVLDDNRLLTLPSGWRIQFGNNVNFVFETHSLEHASPATVSRMGVILLSDDVSCGLDLLSNWVQRTDIEQETGRASLPLLQQSVEKCMHWFHAHKSDVLLKLHNIALVKQILVQFEYITQNLTGNTDRTTPEELVYLAIESSTTDVVKDNAVDSLHQELSSILGPGPPLLPHAQEWVSDSLLLSPRLSAAEPVLRACLASYTGHLLIVGPDACAKNLLAEHVIKECNSILITIDCTPILEPSDIIAELKRNNVVRSGGQSGGISARVTLLVRSLHRAHVDVWGTSAVHSFLLQLIEYSGFWSRGGDSEGGASAAWSGVARFRLIATADQAVLSPRLAASLAVYVMQEADEDELLELVKCWLQQNIGKSMPVKDIIVLAGTILTMFKEVTEIFHSRPQYNWNASHLRRWCENVKWYSPANMEQLDLAITAEANAIFRDRLVTDEEKSRFTNVTRKYFKGNNDQLYFTCKLRGDGVFMEPVDYGLWHHTTEKLINQCLSEYDYNIFGDSGAEICSEMAILCDAMTRACNGNLSVCVGSAGVGRRAAALITAAALSASALFVHHPTQLYNTFKNAISSAASGSRTVVVVCECAARSGELAQLEALRRATHAHALPAPFRHNQLSEQDLDNIKTNLGIVICLDEHQENLSELLEKFPMLYNDAHMLWLDKWSQDTLRDMPALVIQRLSKENMSEMSKEQIDAIPANGFIKIYNSLDADSLKAPCRYVHFIKAYYNIVVKKKSALLQRQTMLSSGVEALRRARSEVGTLQKEAAAQEALLSEKQASANSALDQISATVRATTDKKEEMHALKRNIELENDKLQLQKKEIEAELASVEPVIAAARAAVGDIRPESLSEVRSLRAPPDVVRDVLEGVLRLMGIADTSWHSMKNFLSKRGVKEDIRCLDASQISSAALASVQKLVASRSASFTAAAAKRASAACAPLAAWVRANIDYAQALQRVQPLKNHQAQLHRNLQEAEDQLTALSTGLATVDERVAALKEQLGQHTRDAAALELRLSTAVDTIRAATGLLDQLAHEYDAWETDLKNIHKEVSDLNQRSLLAAAYIVYLPDSTEPESREYIKKWGTLIGFEDATFSVINFLSTTEKQLKWEAEGLSTDLSAIKNAVLVDQVLESPKCGLTPLIIDPDGEGLAWLRNTLADMPCDFVSQHSEKLLTAVQYAVRLGRILIITDVDSVHHSWSALVRSLPAARLLLLTRDEALPARLPPHLARRLASAHFTARLHPLTDQLINYALQQQNPDISEKAKEIKLQKVKLQKQQHELQENLLGELSRNGNILHDAGVLASLNKTRAAAESVAKALAHAMEIEEAAATARAHLAASARRAATLALAVKRLHTRWPLVSLPIDAAHRAYVDAVRKTDQTNSPDIVKYLTRRIIEGVLLALHKKDKYIVVLHLLKQVYDDLMPEKLWQIFIGNDEINDALDTKEIKKLHPWVPEECLKGIAKLKVADEDLYNRLSLNNAEEWKQFMSSGEINMLNKYKLSQFESVVSVAAIRPDSLYRAVVAFVDGILGAGAVFGVSGVEVAARGRRPVLLLAAHAHDALAAHAPPHALTTISAGAGEAAWHSALAAARSSGGWLALSAAGAPFSPELQTFVAEEARGEMENCNEEFRLWILSEYRDVPPLIADSCINVILEAPEGVKNNVMSTMSAWGSERAEPMTTRLLACLALFHALVQERRNYIPQGWSRWYAWEWGELSACARAARAAGGGGGGSALCLALYGARVQCCADSAALAALHARALPPAHAPPTYSPPIAPQLPPPTQHIQAYASAFAALPEMDSPQLLGLPANCRAAWEKNAATHITTGLKELNCTVVNLIPTDGATSTKSLASLWKKLMSGSPLLKEGWSAGTAAGGWWGGAVRGEAAAAARAARVIHAALRVAARKPAATLHEVPESWQVAWAGPRSPGAYLREFCHRARAAITRLDQQAGKDYMPPEVDLRGWMCGGRAVWALRARTAERRRVPPTALLLTARTGDGRASDEEVVLVGLRLSGAESADGGLAPARAQAPPHAPAPPLHAKYITQESSGKDAPEGWVDVPVYSSESREDLLFTVRLQLARSFPRQTALLNAVALFVALLD